LHRDLALRANQNLEKLRIYGHSGSMLTRRHGGKRSLFNSRLSPPDVKGLSGFVKN
jgi:hypothetical protein